MAEGEKRSPLALEHTPVESKAVTSYAYHPESKTLQVKYARGATYSLLDVPQEAVDKLLAAKSFGGHLNEFITGKYEHFKHE